MSTIIDWERIAKEVIAENEKLKLQLQNVSGIIAEIDNLKKFNVESVDSDGKRVIEYDKDGMFVDANELDKKILSYR